ncbi:bifunctional metallophosphatase/5'-nucleotidase [Neobacillus bataviensis]|uniref:bifunctional metallophosphatase/5'-nucleotidase n=1 Tax=Neobacillus bataviensis TaxID=220685 RepID=UPI001CBD67AD|nr:bifunctional UDP-sugar hydrolase/5'-nucleotidase [Neobacillus bataviensis]
METIHIYHTNDVHSHLENWPRIEQFLKQRKTHHQKHKEEMLLFDIGDFIDRWHPYSEASKGKGNIQLLNESEYNAITIGNNEGINLPYDDLDHLYEDAHFDILAANFYKKNQVYPSWVKPYKIYPTKNGTRIGVIGVTANFAHLYELLGWKLTDPIMELKKWLPSLKEQSDIIICLSHLGLKDDEKIASELQEIDIILGAHTHHYFENGRLVGETLLGAAGKYGYLVGHVTLKLNDQKQINDKKAIVYDVKDLPESANEQEQVQAFLKLGKELLSQKVTTLQEPLLNDPYKETNFSRLLCSSLKEWCKSDIAMINAGLLLGSLSGEVTEYDLLTICPHPINPCVVELTGREFKNILSETQDASLPHKQIKGLGFRGDVLGIFVYEGILVQDGRIFMNGKPIEMEERYTLALPDMFTFGHFFKEVIPSKQKTYFLPEFLRDLLKWKLQQMS